MPQHSHQPFGRHDHHGLHDHGLAPWAASGHAHQPQNYNRAFMLGVGLNVLYILVEAGFGLAIGSMALLADAGHNLSDVFGLLLAWAAHYLTGLPRTKRRTYGWRSSSILAAIFNGQLLLIAVGGIAWECIGRLRHPEAAPGSAVIWVALAGVVINGVTAWLFVRGSERDLNIRGAFLHMAADAAVSLGVVLAGVGILLTGWTWIDPVVGLMVAVVILMGAWGLLQEAMNLALHAVPRNIDPDKVQRYLEELPGVAEVHDLHIWAMSTTETALTAHLIRTEAGQNPTQWADAFLHEVSSTLHQQFGIAHSTLQLETGEYDPGCRLAGSC